VLTEPGCAIADAARAAMKALYGCESDADLEHELKRLHDGEQNELYVFLHDPAHCEDTINELRATFTQKHLHIVWLAGAEPFGDLTKATESVECILPEIKRADEEVAVKSRARARARLESWFSPGVQ
jgi:hypothetical protein